MRPAGLGGGGGEMKRKRLELAYGGRCGLHCCIPLSSTYPPTHHLGPSPPPLLVHVHVHVHESGVDHNGLYMYTHTCMYHIT